VAAAAEVDEARRAVDERGEQVGSDDVNGHHLRAGVDAGVVDDRVHAAQGVDVAGNAADLLEVGQVADDDRSPAVDEVAGSIKPVAVANVDEDVVAVGEQCLRR
jgi:hypothetical protein